MMRRFQLPRLLPVTIAVLAFVLVAKSSVLVRSAIVHGQPAAFIASSWASGADASAAQAKPGEKSPEKSAEKSAEKSGEKPTAKPGPETPKQPSVADIPPVPTGPPPMTEGEKALLLDLRARREQLDAREAALASRELMLVATEKKLSARVEELQGLQQRLESLDASHKQQDVAAWQGLVKVYEDMKPRDAATIFNELGMPVLLAVIDRMKEAKASAILAAMLPEKAREVTTQLAQKRTKAAASVDPGDKPAGTTGPRKAPGSGT